MGIGKQEAGFEIVRSRYCVFPPLGKLAARTGLSPYNSRFLVHLDAILASAFAWNLRYHATSTLQRFRPVSVYLVLAK